jgi:hypothetical protein
MTDNRENNSRNTTDDRRDVAREGSSLSGSTKRNNDATEKALHPEPPQAKNDAPLAEGGISARSPESEEVDQDPGERQKENQNRSKDDPLAA